MSVSFLRLSGDALPVITIPLSSRVRRSSSTCWADWNFKAQPSLGRKRRIRSYDSGNVRFLSRQRCVWRPAKVRELHLVCVLVHCAVSVVTESAVR